MRRLVAMVLVCSACAKPVKPMVLAGRVLLESGPVTGEVLIGADGKIACAAESCASAAGYASAIHLALGDAVISPGLINAHGHLEFDTVAPQAHGNLRYQHRHDWRKGAEGATALPDVAMTEDDATVVAAELRSVLGGATSLLASGDRGGLARNLNSSENAEGLTGKAAVLDTFPLGDAAGALLTTGCDYPSTPSPAKAFAGGAYSPHVGEAINAAGHNELTCLTAVVTSRTALVHAMAVNAQDVAALHTAGASLIWSPRSNLGLYGDTAPVTVFRALGVPIALGTDWVASGSMNLLRELACADSFNRTALGQRFTDAELWHMVTDNGAAASGFGAELGTLKAGLQADLTVFSGTNDYRAVIGASVEDVKLVLRGGHPLTGDAALVAQLQTDCEPLDVCGVAKVVCLDGTQTRLKDVQAAAAKTYPLFFCRDAVPEAEPTCVPSRDTYPAGATALDRDGDGIADAADDCPATFNPVRPMDGTAQADVDADGFGDACDGAPLDASSH
jgi:hypothetical protein